jgi:hypothetical protein
MVPAWMIEELERARREREDEERRQLRIELPVPTESATPPAGERREPIVIEL